MVAEVVDFLQVGVELPHFLVAEDLLHVAPDAGRAPTAVSGVVQTEQQRAQSLDGTALNQVVLQAPVFLQLGLLAPAE